MNSSALKFLSKFSVILLSLLGLSQLAAALWSVFDDRYKTLAYTLADVGYIDLWILRYISLCLFASSIITLVMCLIIIWGLCSAHVFLFIASTMISLIVISELTISILTFKSKYESRLTLLDQLPKLVITYQQGTDERAKRALDLLQYTFHCCGAEGRVSYQNNVPSSCQQFGRGCLSPTLFFLDTCIDVLAFVLLFFGLIKLFIVLFFYSFLCSSRHVRSTRAHHLVKDSSIWRHSSSFDSSSTDAVPKRYLLSNGNSSDNTDDPSASPSHPQLKTCYDQYVSRKLSSISEKTERTETDDSEPDLSHYKPKRKSIITRVSQKRYPSIKTRKKILRDDDHGSGVERSLSEKSLESHQMLTTSSLGFSKVFITSVIQTPSTEHTLESRPPKPILKKSDSNLHTNGSTTALKNTPKPIPRTSLKHDESFL